MSRRRWSIVLALSLLPCTAVAGLWLRSYFRIDVVSLASTRLHRAVLGGGGAFLESLLMERVDGNWYKPSAPTVRYTVDYRAWHPANHMSGPPAWAVSPYRDRQGLVGLSWGSDLNRARPHLDGITKMREETFYSDPRLPHSAITFQLVGTRVWIPYWLVLSLTALPPAYLLARRPRPTGSTLCHHCGYDLRASKDRCPECGTLMG
jgi:hypothetical protein